MATHRGARTAPPSGLILAARGWVRVSDDRGAHLSPLHPFERLRAVAALLAWASAHGVALDLGAMRIELGERP